MGARKGAGMTRDVDWQAAHRKRQERAHERYQRAAERVIAEKMVPPKRTPWMVDDEFGNPWRQVGDIESCG